jgi:hypothetical protein
VELRSPRRTITVFVAAAVLTVSAVSCDPGSTRSALLPGEFRTYGAWAVDIDRDGDQDVLVNNHGLDGSGLYLNDGTGRIADHGGVFKDYPGQNEIWLDRHDCDLADVDRNGRTDIFCSTGSMRGTSIKRFPYETNELLLQQADGSFLNRSDVWGVSEPTHRGRDVAFVNADGDAYPDLITTADPRTDGLRSETILYLDNQGRGFVDTGRAGLMVSGMLRCLEKADWNRDGFTDVAICPYHGGVRLYEATRSAGFKDVTTARGAGSTTTRTWDVAFGDVDGDGFDDLVRANTTSVAVRLWNPSTKRFESGQGLGQSDAQDLALGRFDAGAALDLYVVNRGCVGCSPSNPTDQLYLGNGDGTFRLSERFDSPGVGDFVSIWDATGNGRVRWIVGNGWGPVYGPLERIAAGAPG